MKILIISQNSFPLQGPRAFRTQELSEELARKGHDVSLYTVHGSIDYSEYEGKTGVKMKNIVTRLHLRANDDINRSNIFDRFFFHYFHRTLMYPEIEFYFLMDSIIQKEKDIDLLITIAYPHTIHWGVARSKKRHPKGFPKVWIADCGDPFALNPMEKVPHYLIKYEKEWCSRCNYIAVPTEGSKDGYFPEYRDKIKVIPQGFDFSKTPIASYQKNSVPTFVFAGSIYKGLRDPHSFMDYLLTLKTPYKFKMIMRTPLEKKYEIESNGQIEYVLGKGRKEVIYECSKADFLINILNPTTVQTPSKLIDYGISQRPILNIENDFRDDSDFKDFLKEDYRKQFIVKTLNLYKIENVAEQFVALAQ